MRVGASQGSPSLDLAERRAYATKAAVRLYVDTLPRRVNPQSTSMRMEMILILWIDIKKAMVKYPEASYDDLLTHAYSFAKTRYWETQYNE